MASSDENKPAHARRRRYRGTHPRKFGDKYKELAPEKYPEIVAHLRARGQTPAGQHVPILVEEVLTILEPSPGQRGVDATLGWGGHAERFLARVQPGGHLLGLDLDPIELPKTEARLRGLGFGPDHLTVQRMNFAGLRAAVNAAGWSAGADFIFADLGLSSMQIDDPSRGFSFKADGPLDMRMNPSRGLPAAEWLDRVSAEALTVTLQDNGDEPFAEDIAASLVSRRDRRGPRAFATTLTLSTAVRGLLNGRMAEEEVERSIRRVFQAIRIAVNDEYGSLDAWLRQLPTSLVPGGRVAVITFHSGEDRRVKKAFDADARAGRYSHVSREVLRPSAAEQRANPRAKAAKLRWARK